MIVALYILAAIVVVGALCLLAEVRHRRKAAAAGESAAAEPEPEAGEECCGMHITCEKDSLLASVSAKVEYYDDEELDRFKGRKADDYDSDEIEEFRDVLLTLLPEDIAGWGRSVQLRGIELPTEVREELLLIVREEREKKSTTHSV